jgi:hypothetical protein
MCMKTVPQNLAIEKTLNSLSGLLVLLVVVLVLVIIIA